MTVEGNQGWPALGEISNSPAPPCKYQEYLLMCMFNTDKTINSLLCKYQPCLTNYTFNTDRTFSSPNIRHTSCTFNVDRITHSPC